MGLETKKAGSYMSDFKNSGQQAHSFGTVGGVDSRMHKYRHHSQLKAASSQTEERLRTL